MKYSCDSYVDSYEYGKMAPYFMKKMWLGFSMYGTFYNLILAIIIYFLTKNTIDVVGLFLIIEVVILILFRLKIREIAKLAYNVFLKKNMDNKYKLEFYDDCFIKIGKTTITEKYDEIDKCIETDSNFYLQDSKKDIIYIIEKNECELDLIVYIRKKFENLDSRLGGSINFKNK